MTLRELRRESPPIGDENNEPCCEKDRRSCPAGSAMTEDFECSMMRGAADRFLNGALQRGH